MIHDKDTNKRIQDFHIIAFLSQNFRLSKKVSNTIKPEYLASYKLNLIKILTNKEQSFIALYGKDSAIF